MRLHLPDMHRVQGASDWAAIPPEEWNPHQQRAAATNGWDTPGNRLTARGFAFSVAGMSLLSKGGKVNDVIGTAFLAAGRRDDLKDGEVAEATGTKSERGEAFDAGADTALALISGMLLTRSGVIPKAESKETRTLIGIKLAATGISKARGREAHVSRVGKYQAFAFWSGVGFRSLGRVASDFGLEKTSERLTDTGDRISKLSSYMNRVSTPGYVWNALGPKKTKA
jgi:phosphatidylglycerophosphate synthase